MHLAYRPICLFSVFSSVCAIISYYKHQTDFGALWYTHSLLTAASGSAIRLTTFISTDTGDIIEPKNVYKYYSSLVDEMLLILHIFSLA